MKLEDRLINSAILNESIGPIDAYGRKKKQDNSGGEE